MKRSLFFLLLLTIPVLAFSQDDKVKKFGISFTGYVKADIFWDSRQVVTIRDGHFLLYPMNENLDANGEDLNAVPSFNILTIQTRLRGNITGPDVWGAKTSGAIEGEFFGHSNGDINGFRLRHAFVKLDWSKSMLMVGQYWNPMFIVSCFPGTISFNTGIPFLPFSRNPQIRYMYRAGKFNLMATAYSQVDFKSNGPDGANSKYLRNTAIPALNLRFEYVTVNAGRGTTFIIGASGNFKTLKPRLSTIGADGYYPRPEYKSNQTISSLSATVYSKYKFKKLTVKLQGTYGQDVFDFTMIGGYAEKDTLDHSTGAVDYTNIKTMAVWADIHSNGKKMQLGLFMGYSKNLGSANRIGRETSYREPYYSRGNNIGYAYRLSPRFIYNIGKFRIAPEIEYTVAAYGTPDEYGVVQDTKEISNFRFLLGVYFFF